MRGINIKKSTLLERLQLHQIIFECEIASFRQYIINIRQSIKKQQEEFNQLFERIREREADAEGDCSDVYEFYREEDYLYNSFTSATYNSSTLISLYSLFEFNLMKLCTTLQECLNSNIKHDVSKKINDIEKSTKYLELVASIEFTDLETIWKDIDNFRILRNRIAHNNSCIIKNKKKAITEQVLYEYVSSEVHLSLNEYDGTIIINNDQLLLNFSVAIEIFIRTVIKKLQTSTRLLN